MGTEYRVRESLPGTDRPAIAAGRVTMRRFTRPDLDRRAEWPPYEAPMFAHLNLMLPTRERRDAWFDREDALRSPWWFAVDDEHGELIGSITLREISRWKRSSRLGIHLHPERLGKGYGTETMWLFLKYYFTMLGWRLLKLDVAAWNHRAIRCYEKLGFVREFEFWRPNTSGVHWLLDARFEDVRWAVRGHRGMERILHYEMHMTREAYQTVKAEDRGPESAPRPDGTRGPGGKTSSKSEG
jgi:RimJ/RimL family protein N-acetyltransferase